jgi:hypothetical protein
MRSRFLGLVSALALAVLFSPHSTFAQGSSAERIYQESETAVDNALRQVHASIGGRLPVLDGFVDSDQALDNYSRGYYQCTVQVTPATSGGTLVRVKAKITAWYAGSGSTPGGYRVFSSNGRLEADLLDRLKDALGATASGRNVPSTASTAARNSSPAVSPVPADVAPTTSSSRPEMPRSAPPVSLPEKTAIPQFDYSSSARPASANEDFMSLRERHEAAEQQRNLIADIQNLEEIQRDQVHPTDLAAVKRAGTSVLSRPASGAQVVFHADAGDEFQMIEKQGNWVHVRIAGPSRGWIQRSELEMPTAAESPNTIGETNGSKDLVFHVSREEKKTFPGKWEPLHGKTVEIIWVEPSSSSATSSADAKRSFAKSVFTKAYQEIASASQPVAGVVIVFDSADGGQVSATLTTLKEWQAGSLSEASFWSRCALDPSDFLQEPSKAAGGNL